MIVVQLHKNIFDSGCQALVNPVNIKGVSGAGLAKVFKEKFPENQKNYENACKNGWVSTGNILLVYDTFGSKFILNFPTKADWKEKSKLDYIDKGMDALIHIIQKYDIRSVAFPMLGCGLGGLKAEDVFPIMRNKLDKLKDGWLFEVYC